MNRPNHCKDADHSPRTRWMQENANRDKVSIPQISFDEWMLCVVRKEGKHVVLPPPPPASRDDASVSIAPTEGHDVPSPWRRPTIGVETIKECPEDEEFAVYEARSSSAPEGSEQGSEDEGGADDNFSDKEEDVDDDHKLSAYELMRLQRVRRNEERLKMLGLAGTFADMRRAQGGGSAASAGKKRQSSGGSSDGAGPSRRSNRPKRVYDYKKLSDGKV